MKHWKIWPFIIAGTLFVLCLGGVSSAADKPPIKIGLLEPLTGPFALIAKDNQDGHLLYLDKVGDSVAGRKIQLIVADTEAKGDVALSKARMLVEKDHVDIVAGLVSSACCYAVAPYVAQKKVPTIITGNCGAEGLTKNPKLRSPYFWKTTQSSGMFGYALSQYLLKNNMKKAVLVASGYAGGYEVADGFAHAFIDGGGTVIQEIYPALGTTDFGPFMAQINRNADAVVTFVVGTDGLRFAQQYTDYGLKGKLPLFDLSELLVSGPNIEQLKDAALGIYSVIHYAEDSKTPANEDFLRRFDSKYKDRLLSFDVAAGYSGMHIIYAALKDINGDVGDTQKLFTALRDMKINTVKGSFRFDSYQNVIEDFYIKKVVKVNGKYTYKTVYKVPDVSEFWKWKPKDVINYPFGKLHGKYTNINKSQLDALIKSASR